MICVGNSLGGLPALGSITSFCRYNGVGNIAPDMCPSNNSASISDLDFMESLRASFGILSALLSAILSQMFGNSSMVTAGIILRLLGTVSALPLLAILLKKNLAHIICEFCGVPYRHGLFASDRSYLMHS